MFPKRQTLRKAHISHTHHHAHTPPQPHAHHATRTHATHHAQAYHAFLYVKVYLCLYCGRESHLTKFCYDRVNASNDYLWVRKTNILGPKIIWVPKSTPLLIDIGTHQDSKM